VAKASGRSLVAGFVIVKIAGTLIGHVVAVCVLTLKSVLQLPNESAVDNLAALWIGRCGVWNGLRSFWI
jgi:hypothetical protein